MELSIRWKFIIK